MTVEREFGEFASLWSGVAEPADVAEVDEIARLIPRIARREMIAEAVVAGGLFLAVVLVLLARPGIDTLMPGGILLAMLGWSAWRRHRLGQMARQIERAEPAAYLSDSIAAKRAELRRSAIGLALIAPAFLLTTLLMFAVRSEGDDSLWTFLFTLATQGKGVAVLILFAASLSIFLLDHRRIGRELSRLVALEAGYAEEDRQDRLAAG